MTHQRAEGKKQTQKDVSEASESMFMNICE